VKRRSTGNAFFITFAKLYTPVLRKFFPSDKNYILEEAQLSLEQPLLQYLVDYVKVQYLLKYNPLGIVDEMSEKITNHKEQDYRHLHEFYLNLAGLFRFRHYNDNQLTFLFEGGDDFKKYQREWTEEFKRWVKEFCQQHNFLRAVLDLTVYYPVESPMLMVDNRMNAFITQHFEIKFHPQKGIVKRTA
jgi:hypothetical protein